MQIVDSFLRTTRSGVRTVLDRLDSWTLHAFNSAPELRGRR